MSCAASVCPLTGSSVKPRSNTTNFCTAGKYCSLSLVFSTSTSAWRVPLLCNTGPTQLTSAHGHRGQRNSRLLRPTHVSVADQLPLEAISCNDVALGHVDDAAFVGQVEVCCTELTLKQDLHTSTYSRGGVC